jgi:hypothetical protein
MAYRRTGAGLLVPVGRALVVAFDMKKHTERVEGDIVKRNAKTCWVRLPDGHVIKRHLEKHRVGPA